MIACRIKAQIQANAGNSSPVSIIRSAIQKEGFRGLYNGIGVALVGGMPACCLYLTSYEVRFVYFVSLPC